MMKMSTYLLETPVRLGFLFVGVSAFAMETPSPVEKPSLILGQGEQRLLRTPGLSRFSLGSPVVRAMSLSQVYRSSDPARSEHLLIKGISPGTADLWVFKKDGSSEHRTVRVKKMNSDDLSPTLARALSALEEAEVIPTGNGVVLRGEIHSLAEAARISTLLLKHPKTLHNETEPTDSLLSAALSRLHAWIQSSPHSSQLRIERIGYDLWVRGNVERPSYIPSIERQLRSIFPLVRTEIESMPDHAPTVHFRVFLLELKRSYFQSLGISWPASVEGAFRVTASSIQPLSQLDLALQALEGKGSAKILSNPELVVRAPGEAELFAGGELPIRTQSRFHSAITWRNYGLTLRLKVTHTAGDRIRLDIFTEVSHLDTQISQDKIPGIQANKLKTQVDARFGVPLLLSGLLQQGIREEAKGLPFLRNLPILGTLFGSQNYLNEHSELVAILYPHSTPPTPSLIQTRKFLPSGALPPSRNWIDPQQERNLRNSKEYPWNVLN